MQPLYKDLRQEGDDPKATWRQWIARRRLHWLKEIIAEQFEKVTSRSGSHRFGNEGNSSASESPSDDPDSYDNVNAKYPVGSFVYVNGWCDYDGVGQVKKVKRSKNGLVTLYDIMREKQRIFYNVPEGALTEPIEEEMDLAPERWRREQKFQQLSEHRREMKEILHDMEWDKSLNKHIPVKLDLINNDGDLYADLFFKMHRELSEEIIISASSNKYILNPYNEAFWCKTSIKAFRTILLHMSSFELSPYPLKKLLKNITNACRTAVIELHNTHVDDRADNVAFLQKPLSKKYYEQSKSEKTKEQKSSPCVIPFFDVTPATSTQYCQLKSTEAELQAYYDVLELCNMSDEACNISLSDFITEDTQEVSIVMTKPPWKNSSDEKERLMGVIPRNINAVKSGCVETYRYWYLWHQILSLVHPLASEIDWTQESNGDGKKDNVVDVDNSYSLENLILILGIDLNDMELMNF